MHLGWGRHRHRTSVNIDNRPQREVDDEESVGDTVSLEK